MNSARHYQKELAETAYSRNSIVVLDTGLGKTLIAVLVANRFLAEQSDKKVLFLAPTSPLVQQQGLYLKHVLMKSVFAIYGGTLDDAWSPEEWSKLFTEHHVLCMTPQILLQALEHAFLSLNQVSLMVYDEVHNAVKDHPYATLMKSYYRLLDTEYRPRVLGLTASPIHSSRPAMEAIRDLEIIMNAHLISVPISAEFNQKIHTEIFKYEPFSSDSFPQLLLDLESATRLHPSIFKEIEHTAKHLYQNLGEFSAFKYIHFSLRNMTHKARGHHEYRFDELILSWMERLQFVTLPNFFNRYPPTISTKLMELVRFLTEYRDNQDFCCLIFVQRRMTAFCLQQVLRLFPELEFLRIGVLIGHTRQGESMSMETMQQSTIVKDFKQGKINVLIATRIGEEGLDIPYCHLVIRFDFDKSSMNLVNLIQSRGRARVMNAKFVLFLENGNIEHYRQIAMLHDREREMKQALVQRLIQVPNYSEQEESLNQLARFNVRVFMVPSTGARLTYASSLRILYTFCSQYRTDEYYQPEPLFTFQSDHSKWRATLKMPNGCPEMIKSMTSKPTNSKQLAKEQVAFETCKLLYELKLLNDYLVPIRDQRVLSKTKGKLDSYIGTRKKLKRQKYTLNPPHTLLEPWETENKINGYLTVLTLTPTNTTDTRVLRYGLVTPYPIPGSNHELILYPHLRPYSLKMIPFPATQSFTPAQFKQMLFYHHQLLKYSLKLQGLFQEIHPYLAVPFKHHENDCQIDFETIEQYQELSYQDFTVGDIVIDVALYDRHFMIQKVIWKTPFDTVEVNGKMVKAADTYSKPIQSKLTHEAPIVIGKLLKRKLNMISEHNYGSFDDEKETVCVLAHQFLKQSPFPSDMIHDIFLLPSLFFYLECLHRAHGLKLECQLSLSESNLLKALTFSCTNLPWNYERPEILGDAYLKLAVTLNIWINHPFYQEGSLSILCHRIVSNMELFKIAKKSKVPEYLNVIPFTKKLWRPLNLKSPAEPLEMDISDKQLADVFESILGMAYEQGGFSLANEALHNMYSSEFLVDWQDYLSKIHWSTVSMIMPEHWERIKRVQEIIGYDFKRPEILLEALTHPSVIHDIVPSYQRLEFLGDAVLGFNVVRYFYHRDLNSPPGKITDMKDESVCNVFLAVLCKRAGLHRFLCHFSSPLQTAIVRFCEALDEKEAEYLASDSEIPQLYWQDMDAPKAMSDVLEAIVGAVFLDSNLNVEMSWKVMEKLWKPMVDEFIRPAFIKRHPVRELGLLLRHVGCDVWKIRTRLELENAQYLSNIIIHDHVVAVALHSTKKGSRKIAAELAIEHLNDKTWLKEHCTCPSS